MGIAPPLVFTRLERADLEIFAALEWKSAGRIYGPAGNIEDTLKEIEENIFYLIRQENVYIGTIAYRMRPDDSAYISCLNVDPPYRRRGVARAAMVYILECVKGVSRVDLVTHPENEAALRLYSSLGFRIESRKENYFGDGEPRLVLAKHEDMSGKSKTPPRSL